MQPGKKQKYENALDVSREFIGVDLHGQMTTFQWWVIRVGLGIWRELDTISALYRERN